MTNSEKKVLRALALMAEQYLDNLDHQCMSAGEEAVKVLAQFGLVIDEGRKSRWTEAGRKLLTQSV